MGFANSILQAMHELLVVKPSSLGDIVHALRVMASVRSDLPGLRISWVVRDLLAPFVQASGIVDQVYEFHRGAGPFAFWRLLMEIRRSRFDEAFDMQGLLRSAVMIAFSQADKKWGRHDGREGATFFYDKVSPPKKGTDTHAIDILLPFKEVLGLKLELTGRLRFPESRVASENEDLLAKVTRGGKLPLVTLFPESRRLEKEWLGFYELAQKLINSGKVAVAVACTREENEKNWQGVAHLGGKTELTELPALITASDLIVSNDSAPLHLASALECPLVGLFGPTSPIHFGPYPVDSPNSKSLRAEDGDLARLTVETVENTVFALLKEL